MKSVRSSILADYDLFLRSTPITPADALSLLVLLMSGSDSHPERQLRREFREAVAAKCGNMDVDVDVIACGNGPETWRRDVDVDATVPC